MIQPPYPSLVSSTPDEQTESAHVAHDGRELGGDRARARQQLLAARARPLRQPFFLEHVHRRERRGAGQLAAAERRGVQQRRLAERAIPDVGTRDERTDRHDAAGEPLRQRHHVGNDAVAVAGEAIAAAAESRLHLVGDEERAGRGRKSSRTAFEIPRRRNVDAAFALHRLDDEGRRVAQRNCPAPHHRRTGRRANRRATAETASERSRARSPRARRASFRDTRRWCRRSSRVRSRRAPV